MPDFVMYWIVHPEIFMDFKQPSMDGIRKFPIEASEVKSVKHYVLTYDWSR